MTDDERKRWGLLVSMHKVRPETTAQAQLSDCILAADAELAALRGEVERLKQELEADKNAPRYWVDRCASLQAALSRYREAVEWAIKTWPGYANWKDELRRRAGEG